MTKCSQSNFSLVQMENEWFWCSHDNALIGPFPSQKRKKMRGTHLGL
jgi:hypothetical protein